MAFRPLAAALTIVFSLLAATPAHGETFTVNTTDDLVGAPACTQVVCTLRSALAAATSNTPGTDDTIVLPAATYVLSSQLGQLTVPTNETRLFIRGAGANVTTIQPQAEAAIRILEVQGGAGITVSDLTMRGGRVTSGVGGNLSQLGGSSVTLERVRVTSGSAPQGGGIATSGVGAATTLTIRQSLIDGNTTSGTAISAAGGGLYVAGATASVAVSVTDTTIAGNGARNGAGVAVVNNSGSPPTFRGVTLARNVARAGSPSGIGGITSSSSTVNFQGSIVAGNTSTVNLGPGPVQVPANCAITPAATDQGGNLETGTDCGLAGHQNTDPLLAPALDTSQPPVLAIPANSPAVDIADCGGRTLDQRGVARPQLAACDAGAFEYQVPPPEPTPTPTASPAPSATATPTPTATPVPTPVVNRTVVVETAKGTVLVRLPGTDRFVRLGAADDIPVGSTVDARKGEVFLTSIPRAGAPPERAKFWDGIFRISQARGITTLTLTEQLAPCSSRARAAQTKPKTRRLWGDGKGKFRTKGRYAAATVRGTKWLVTDGCRYTRTRVTQGSVNVRDEVRERTVIVRKGRSYTARARR